MRILLDECLPRQLARELVGHAVRTVSQCGWSSFENGRLLALAVKEFDVFITIDRRLTHDRRPPSPLAIIGLTAVNNRVETICALVPEILHALEKIRSGEVARVGR